MESGIPQRRKFDLQPTLDGTVIEFTFETFVEVTASAQMLFDESALQISLFVPVADDGASQIPEVEAGFQIVQIGIAGNTASHEKDLSLPGGELVPCAVETGWRIKGTLLGKEFCGIFTDTRKSVGGVTVTDTFRPFQQFIV